MRSKASPAVFAALYCDRLYVLRSGEVVASGAPEEVLRADHIHAVYGVGSEVRIHPVTGRPHIAFFPGSYGTNIG